MTLFWWHNVNWTMNPQKDVKLQILTASTVLTRSSPLEVLLLLLIVSTMQGGILEAQKLL